MPATLSSLQQFQTDMALTHDWVQGGDTDSVTLGGVSTPTIRNAIRQFLAGGGVSGYQTKALMDADLAHAANSIAFVAGDSLALNNGWYIKSGASGTGSWVKSDDVILNTVTDGAYLLFYDQSILTNNGYISYITGGITDSDTDIGYKYSNQITVTEAMKGATLNIHATATLGAAFAVFYDAEGKFISGLAGNENTSGSIAVPNNASKMRLGAKTASGNSFRATISAKSALTAVAQKLSNYEDGLANETYLKWDTSILTNDGYISATSGTFIEAVNYKYSNAIAVPRALIGATVSVQASATMASVFVAFYSLNYTYIGGLDASESTSGSIAVPDNAWFMRFCAKTVGNNEFHAEVKLQSCLDAAQKNTNNYDAYHWTNNHLTNYGYVQETNGLIIDVTGSSTEFSYSDAISTRGVKGASIVISAGSTLGAAFVAFYDAAGKFISALSGAESKTGSIMVPLDAATMRFSGRTNYSFDAKVYVYNSVRALDYYLDSLNHVRVFDKSILVNPGYITSTGETTGEYASFHYSNLFDVDFMSIKVFSNLTNSGCLVAFYDEDNAFISGRGGSGLTDYISVDVPKRAKKCRFSAQLGSAALFYAITEGRLSSINRLIDESISKNSASSADAGGTASCIGVMQDIVLTTGRTVVLFGDSITAGVGSTGYFSYTYTDGDNVTHQVRGNGPNNPQAGEDYQVGELIYEYPNHTRQWYEPLDGNGWGQQIKAYLEKKFDCSVRNFGCSGINSTTLQGFALAKAQSISADIAIIAIGTNNRMGELEDVYGSLVSLYSSFIENGIKPIAVTPIPATVASENSAEYTLHVEDINFAVKKATSIYKVPCIDMFSKLLEYCRYTGTNLDSLFADGLHPNDAGYTVIARLMLEELGLPMPVDGATW